MQNETAKKYYWLKLHRDFFKRHDIQIIEGMENGKDYILFYLKLLVESIDHEGSLRFSETIPYSDKMLASVTHTNIDIVRSAMKVFEELQMVTILDDETIYMQEVSKMIGSETAWAQKKREYRLGLEDKKRTVEDNVRQEKEIEIEKEIDKDNMSTDIDSIVAYLNLKAGTHYQSSTPKTRTLIKARFKEHFTVDDFKTVIDKMTAAWINDSKMRQYLRPETLFGTKFEGYLNRDDKPVTKKGSFNDMMHTEYDMEALEKMLNE